MNIALVLSLILQLSALWNHLNPQAQFDLASSAVPVAKSYPVDHVSIPALIGSESLQLGGNASYYAVDRATGTVMYSHNADTKRPIASVTKLITALVILERHNPDEMVTVHDLPTYDIEAETMGLQNGDEYSVGDLLEAALVPSDNDAADALAIYDSGSVKAFTGRMNAFAARWDIPGTHFASASGLSDSDNFTTARSLSKLALLALKQSLIMSMVQQQSITITSKSGRTQTLTTTNQLLATGSFYGIKTGYTGQAGECFVGLTRLSGHEVITVVLGAGDRFGDTQTLRNWIGNNWQWF